MPGVVAAFGAHDLPALGHPMMGAMERPDIAARTESPLATNVVRYDGAPVALVVADDPYRAADAAAAASVTYEPLPPALDPAQAQQDGALLVHDDVPRNVAARVTRSTGALDDAFAAPDIVLRERFVTSRGAGLSIETRGVVAAPGGEDVVRRAVAAALALPQDAVRVVTPAVGGAFGPKGRIYPEEITLGAVALSLDRPVSWQATRSEDLRSTYQGRGIIIDAALAARADGTILGLRATLTQDCGAYLPNGIVVPESSAQHLIGPYRVPALSAEIVAVYTHKVPLTPLRGGGREGGVFAMERLLDHLARELQLNPLEVRRRNALRPDEFPHDTGYPNPHGPGTIVYDSGDYPTYLEKARALIGYDDVKRAQPEERTAGLYRGVAVTLFLEATGLAKESARVEVADDGGVHVTVGSPSNGQSHATTFAQVCAARLGVPVDTVTVTSGDTAAMGEGTGTFASRMAVMGGNAVALAARSIACPSASSSCRTSSDDVA
jgi:carbon-monoxide dehydrogenase large subunit